MGITWGSDVFQQDKVPEQVERWTEDSVWHCVAGVEGHSRRFCSALLAPSTLAGSSPSESAPNERTSADHPEERSRRTGPVSGMTCERRLARLTKASLSVAAGVDLPAPLFRPQRVTRHLPDTPRRTTIERRPKHRPPLPSTRPTIRVRQHGEEITKLELKRTIETLLVESTRGPIPPPTMLKGYNDAVQDGGARILAMAENEAHHRRQIDWYETKGSVRRGYASIASALTIAVMAMVLAGYMAYLGHPGWATLIFSADVVVVILAFLSVVQPQLVGRISPVRLSDPRPHQPKKRDEDDS